jgi:WD40 repeat protein
VRIWDRDRKLERPHLPAPGTTRSLAWTADGSLLASGSDGGIVCVWDVETGSRLATAACLSAILVLQFGADGNMVRAADSGAATGNRPVSYLFELCNIDSSPAA